MNPGFLSALSLTILTQNPALETQASALAEGLLRLETRLEAQREELHIPGLAIAVVFQDEVIFAKGFGLANVAEAKPVTAETIFAIGSTSKAFTATLAAMLVEEAKFDWDAPITEYLPDFQLPIRSSDATAQVNLRDLLAHRTGFARADLLWASGQASAKEILATVVHSEPWADFRKEFHYNNIMFLAAGEAAAAVSGKSWAELIRERILEPLAMKSTTLSIRDAQKDERLALGYDWNEDEGEFEHKPMRLLDSIAPAGAINSNVLDLTRWVRFLLGRGEIDGKRLVSSAAIEECWTAQNPISGDNAYGLGWFLKERGGRRVVEHGGNIDGFAAQIGLFPDEELGYAILCNVSASPLQQASLSLVWDALMEPVGDPVEKPAALAEFLGVYVGNFVTFKDAKFTVMEKDGKLALDVPGQMTFTLKEPDAEGRRYFELTNEVAVVFVRDEADRIIGLELHQGGLTFELPREGVAIPTEIDLEEAQRFLGKYFDAALNGELTVLIQNNRLAVDVPMQMTCELHAPDSEGKRAFRINSALAVRFEEADGLVSGLTFFERGTSRDCPRVETSTTSEALLTLDELTQLRRADERKQWVADLGIVRMQGTVRLVHMGIEGKFNALAQGVGRYRSTVDLAPFAQMESCYSDGKGATRSTLAPYDELSGKALEQARIESPMLVVSDWREAFENISVVLAEILDERKVWLVRLSGENEQSLTYWVDAETGDVLREDSQIPLPNNLGSLPRTTVYSDYREVAGFRFPYHTETSDDASGKSVYVLEQIQPQVEGVKETDFLLAK